jgi:pimeloyl-ACP methyl ester carboxylesterase
MELRAKLEITVGRAQYHALTRGLARALGFSEESVTVDGVRVPFLARGWGVPLVLVHGFGGDKESWLTMAAWLRGRAVLVPDLPGFGAADVVPPERASARAQAAFLAGFLDALGYSRAHLVGNSMGGGISLRFAADYPARAESISLVGSVGPVVEKSEVLRALDRGENPLILESTEDFDRLMRLVSEKRPPVTPAMRRYLASALFGRREQNAVLFRGWNEPRNGDGVPTALEGIETPALVIHGTRDRVLDVSTGRALAERLPNAKLEILDGVGHVPQLEQPRRVARLIAEFTSRS